MEQFKENYQNQNERMNPQLENMLKSMQSDLANNPAFPKTDANGNPINFVELIAYKRFLDVIEKVKRYTNLQNVTGGGLGQLSSMLMQGVQFIQQVEAPHKRVLENLAVDLVVEEMELPDGVFQFQCKLVPIGSINQDGFQIDGKEPSEEEINQAFQDISQDVDIPTDELFEDEKHKRRFINMLIQGSSKKGHYMFELVRRKVNEYNPNLAETYGKVMSINDLLYWILDDETVRRMAESDSSMGGKEGIEEGEDGDTIIKTEAICFPISLHEIIKGVMEVFGTQGLPDDPQQANLVINAVDSLSNETMDLRLGVPCWEKIYSAYPDFILEEGNRYLQSYLFARYCALPTDEFFRVSRLILSDDPKGAKYFAKMVDEIQNDLQREDYQKNIDDINLDDLLGYKNGGGVNSNYGKFGDDNSNLVNFDIDNLDAFEFRQYENFSKSLSKAQALQVLINDVEGDYSQLSDELSKIAEEQMPMNNYKYGGGVGKGYNVFNYTDNVYATDEVFKTKKLANEFIKEFRNRFSRQGYYRDNQMNKIAIEDIDLLAIPSDFSPFRKFNGGGMIDLFEDYENIPPQVQQILDRYADEFGGDGSEMDYKDTANMLKEIRANGYTFDYGLDNEPYGLRPIGVKINELQGYEDIDDSDEFDVGGEAEFDVYNWDDKMALINLGQIYEYAIELDKIIDENTELEEWIKMKLTRIEQNIADVKHSLEGWEKYSSGGQIAKKQLLHIAKYSKDLIEMIANGSKLMSWQEGKLSVSAQIIDDIYHHLDYKMGNRAVDLENESEDKYGRGGNLNIKDKFVEGGGVGEFPPKGELTNKDNFLLKYEKKGGEYEFFVYKPITKEVSGYNQIKHVCLNKDCPQKMNYEQFINYLYAELYLDDTQYAGGGEVKGWMKEALLNLQLVEDDNSLQISHTNEDSFYVEGDSAEYRVFETYANAYNTALEQVREDLEENPDYFNQDWLFNWIDMDDTLENILDEYYRSYAEDIANEDDSKYNSRLIAEMVESGLMTEDEATSEDADNIAEDNIDNFVDLYVEENMQGDKGEEWYISNFGQDDFRNFIIDNNLIDISGASEDAIDTDGVAHFLSSYDGEEIELDNDVVAYRTN